MRAKIIAILLMTITQVISISTLTASTDTCGAPSYTAATDKGIFLWRNCSTEKWSLRASAGGLKGTPTRYSGVIKADQNFTSVTPYKLEGSDVLDNTTDASVISYALKMFNAAQDGFDFTYPASAQVCFDLETLPQDAQVFIGANKTPVNNSFNLSTLEDCDSPPDPPVADSCGRPAFAAKNDRGIFLWRNCSTDDSWSLRVTAGGVKSPATIYSGLITSEQNFSSVTPYKLEASDVVDNITLASEINYQLKVFNGAQDGFDFSYPLLADVCFNFNILPANASVYLGANKTPVDASFNLETLDACDSPEPSSDMNFVFFLMDDMRWDSLWAMPITQTKLGTNGVSFDNAFITTPLCCPARANILSGGFYSFNTGVLNVLPNIGSEAKFRENDHDTLATVFQENGYKTLFAGGKYLNGYSPPYIPPGWTKFVNNVLGPFEGEWFEYDVIIGSSKHRSSRGNTQRINQYVTRYHQQQTIDFIRASGDSPFLAFFSVFAPHAPAIPDTIDEGLFANYEYRERAYNETDLTDKPDWVANPNRALHAKSADDDFSDDEFIRRQLRSLQSVDRAIGAIYDEVNQQGKLDKTVFIFMSDNGFLWGEHGLFKKGMAYEESIRTPLIMLIPGVTPRSDQSLIAADLDVPATLFDIANITHDTDGQSLAPLLENPGALWRNELFFQHWGGSEAAFGTWSAIRNDNFKLIENAVGEIELYDMLSDPFEQQSLHANTVYTSIMDTMSSKLIQHRGLAIKNPWKAPDGIIGQNYSFQFRAWGGLQPYSWSVHDGGLPAGLTLDEASGELHGIPTSVGEFEVMIKVQDSSTARHSGVAQYDIRPPSGYLTISILPDN